MNDEEKAVLELAEKCGIKRRHNTPLEMWCYESNLLAFAQALRDQEAAKHKAEVAELERRVAGLRGTFAEVIAAHREFPSHRCQDVQKIEAAMERQRVAMVEYEKALTDTSETAKRHDARVAEIAKLRGYIEGFDDATKVLQSAFNKGAAELNRKTVEINAKADELEGKK